MIYYGHSPGRRSRASIPSSSRPQVRPQLSSPSIAVSVSPTQEGKTLPSRPAILDPYTTKITTPGSDSQTPDTATRPHSPLSSDSDGSDIISLPLVSPIGVSSEDIISDSDTPAMPTSKTGGLASPFTPLIGPQPPTVQPDWDPMFDRINSYINSGATEQLSTPITDALWSEFTQRYEGAGHSDLLYRLRYTYDVTTSTLITRCMPTPVHDAIQSFFDVGIKRMIYEHRLGPHDSSRFAVKSGTDVNSFSGEYEGSRKRADLVVMPQKELGSDVESDDEGEGLNSDFPTVAVEVGFSEGYADLKKDMELWLVGSQGRVRAVILICLTETPAVNLRPLIREDEQEGASAAHNKGNENDSDGKTTMPSQSAIAAEAPQASPPRTPYGPIFYSGHVLVGEISGFLEIWRINPESESPEVEVKKPILPAPIHIDPEDCFKLSMLDIFGSVEDVPAHCEPTQEITFDLAIYRQCISRAVREVGRQRLVEIKKRKRQAEGDDGGWRGRKRTKG